MYDNKYDFMYNMIFVRIKLVLGSQLTYALCFYIACCFECYYAI